MTTQTHEIEAWLGDDHDLTDDQVEQLRLTSDEITARYCTPDPDCEDPEAARADLMQLTSDERDAALTAAYRILSGDPDRVVAELAATRRRARQEQALATAGLWQAALMIVDVGERGRRHPRSENAFAARAGVDRATVRKWLGK